MRFCPVFVVLSTQELGKTDLNGQLFFHLVLLALLMLMHVCVNYGCAFAELRLNFESLILTSVCFYVSIHLCLLLCAVILKNLLGLVASKNIPQWRSAVRDV